MKKYGRQRQHPHGYKNPKVIPKRLGLWWEGTSNGNKKRARQEALREIENEI